MSELAHAVELATRAGVLNTREAELHPQQEELTQEKAIFAADAIVNPMAFATHMLAVFDSITDKDNTITGTLEMLKDSENKQDCVNACKLHKVVWRQQVCCEQHDYPSLVFV